MSDMNLNTAVNQHFLDRLIRLAGARRITATQDIIDVHGVTLIARGARLTQEHQQALSGRKLRKTIESSLRVEDAVDTDLIVRACGRIVETCMPINRLLNASARRGTTPLARLSHMVFGDPMRLLLTLADHDGFHALEHAASVSLLSICMASKLQLADDEQQAAGLAGLLHDIGELYIAPGWLAPGKRLLPHEWVHLVAHPRLGQLLVNELAAYPPSVGRAIVEHHERFDGTGYPRQSPGKRISLPGQAVAVAEMIAGLLGKDNPLERAGLALKIVPGEHARELVSAISAALKVEPGIKMSHALHQAANHRPATHDECDGREDARRLFRRLGAVRQQGQDLLDGSGARSPRARDLLGQALVRIGAIERAFASTGLDIYANPEHGLDEAQDGALRFEKAVATREIQWRLRDIARDLALHTAGSPDEAAQFAGLIALLDDDSEAILKCTLKASMDGLVGLAPKAFAGSLPYRN
jgi:hypothetical protein